MMLFTREQLEELVISLYEEAKDDFHWQALIKHRAVAHLRQKGIKVQKENGYYKVGF